MKKLLLSFLVSASFIACTNQQTKSIFDLNNAKKEIEAANKEMSDLLLKGDTVSVANLYSQDGKLMLNNMPSIEGKEKIASFWSGFTKMQADISYTTFEVWGDENFVTEEGNFLLSAKDGSQIDKGKYLVLWKRVEGKLMFFRDIFNSDLPPAAPAK
jgi:ketosteroid isomerase-like protein